MLKIRGCPHCGCIPKIEVFIREYGFCGVIIECPNCKAQIRNAKCRSNGIYLSVDGKEVFEVGDGDVIRISKSKYTVPIVTKGDNSFMEVLDAKLSSH